MRTIAEYIKSRLKPFAMLLLFALVFAVVFALYALPTEAVLYAAAICAFLGIIALVLDFLSFRRRHILLKHLSDTVTLALDKLPTPRNTLEADYQDMLFALYNENTAKASSMNNRYLELSDYYTIWVHQIKTPIAAMRLILQGEISQADADELSYELKRIEQYADMVLTYLRLQSESTDYVLRRCSLDAIVKKAVKKFASQFIRRKISLCYETLSIEVLTDEKWLSFVVEQVLSNALKYTESGGKVSIRLENNTTLEITDTGIGIAPEDLPRIFENGYTGYTGRADRRASGIGLYLCRRICQNLGHAISARSTPGCGTTICLDLSSTSICAD